jgi:hypothetical protein
MSKLAFRAQAVDIGYLPLRQDFLAKVVLMSAQRDLVLGNSLSIVSRGIYLGAEPWSRDATDSKAISWFKKRSPFAQSPPASCTRLRACGFPFTQRKSYIPKDFVDINEKKQ